MSELLQKCINFTGDVDTVASIALGIAAASSEVENDLPENLYHLLENGPFGYDYIVNLDRQLLTKSSVPIEVPISRTIRN